jgi:DNA-binding HxlR family transcriptional regulator
MACFAKDNFVFSCPLQLALHLAGGRWRALIVYRVGRGISRFGELRTAIEGISARMLAQELKALRDLGYIDRKVFAEVPPRTEYTLTREGKKLFEALEPLRKWGLRYKSKD